MHDTVHPGSEFCDPMDRSCSKPWTGVCRTARKAEQLQNSLLQIEGLQVGGP